MARNTATRIGPFVAAKASPETVARFPLSRRLMQAVPTAQNAARRRQVFWFNAPVERVGKQDQVAPVANDPVFVRLRARRWGRCSWPVWCRD